MQNAEQNTDVAMKYFALAQNVYRNLEIAVELNKIEEPHIPGTGTRDVDATDTTLPFTCAYELDEQGVITLKAALPIGNLSIEIKQGKMLVFQQGFGPAMYGYRLQLIEGEPRWAMTHRWIVQEFINPNYPPTYVDYLLDLLGKMIDQVIVRYFPQEPGTSTWIEQVTGGRSPELFAGILTSSELAEAYVTVMHGLWTISQQEGGIRHAKPEVVKEVWNESIDAIRPHLPSLH